MGTLISLAGVVGLWAIGEYAIDLQSKVFREHFVQAGMSETEIPAAISTAKSYAYTLQMIGAAGRLYMSGKTVDVERGLAEIERVLAGIEGRKA